MNRPVVVRVIALLALASFGVGTAWAGAAVGLGDPIAAGPGGEFSVSETDVTFSDGDREVTVLENVSGTESIEIAAADGRLTVDSEPADPLTDAERDRALEIARDNETVTRRLASMDEYELAVEPIYGIHADSVQQTSISGSEWTVVEAENGTEVRTFDVESEPSSVEQGDDEVVISPAEQSYADDDVTVEISEPGSSEPRYEAQVDLAAERVVIVTD
ncbi:hypothetical protein A6E15_16380 [Natrinema saccharevitans]|uniref:Uncharacterized protein n=1 Tax=Natrinema saccharevitans TaxID=301967 RepID=A0A1S8B0J8_9EURY|nr:hypothetical protein [Natrinema saccharevitans]OLZ42442.1 hypothetical protein A6E15_16380 [Natrinema saccharevitans]